jgi:LPXTG-motif cell wall-anchored protein
MDEQPMPTPNSSGVPQHVVGYWYPIEFPIVPLLGLILGAFAFMVLRRRRRRAD